MKEMQRMETKAQTQEQKTEQISVKTDTSKTVKISLTVLACTLGIFLLWAAFAPLNQGASAGGFVTVANYRKVIQHQYGGTIKDILVKEGEEVKKGQVLIKLEDSDIKARYAQIRGEFITALVIQARLNAERAFMSKIIYPEEVLKFKDEPEIKRVIMAQEEFFRARRAKLDTDRRIIMESLSGFKHYAEQLSQQKLSYEKQLQIINGQLQSLKSLSEEGYYPRNRFLDLERAAEDLRGKIAETSANQLRAQATVQEYMMRMSAIERDYLRDVEAELADIEKKLPGLRDSYNAIRDMLDKTEIKAPEDGIAMGLRVHTIGGVISPGQPILEIVPKNAELIVEAKLSPAHIEDVKKGQSADLHFVALDPKKTPILEGNVVYVSPDILTDEATKAPYYLVRVEIKEDSMKKIKKLNKEITPGMPVQVVIKTGSRTFLSYLFKPFLDRLAISFLR
jgi:HlyD family secretion protein/protease secretion system membrane fusion protein/epimerase transport system membrane fusion protein